MEQDVLKNLNQTNKIRNDLMRQIPVSLREYLQMMEYVIRKEFKSFSFMAICGGGRSSNFKVSKQFSRAFKTLKVNQMSDYYDFTANTIRQHLDNKYNPYPQPTKIMNVLIHKGFSDWRAQTLEVRGYRVTFDNALSLDARNYLLRVSKKTERICYVLEATQFSEPETLRFSFEDSATEKENYESISRVFKSGWSFFLKQQILAHQKGSFVVERGEYAQSAPSQRSYDGRDKALVEENPVSQTSLGQIRKPNKKDDETKSLRYVSQQMMTNLEDQQLQNSFEDICDNSMEQEAHERQINEKNLLRLMIPDYRLPQLEMTEGYYALYTDHQNGMQVWGCNHLKGDFKLELLLSCSWNVVTQVLSDISLYKSWNQEVVDSHMKLDIRSENSAVVYLRWKNLSEWYKQRDCLFMRHACYIDKSLLIVDKSVVNLNFIPFPSIHRADMPFCVMKVTNLGPKTKISMHLQIQQGLFKQSHNQELTLRYIKGFQGLSNFCQRTDALLKVTHQFFTNFNEGLTEADLNEPIQSKNEKFIPSESLEASDVDERDLYLTIDDNEQFRDLEEDQALSEPEITEEERAETKRIMKLQENLMLETEKILLDSEQHCILPKEYLRIKHPSTPSKPNDAQREKLYDNYLLNDDFQHESSGYFKLINKRKIEAQNSVLSFIMSTLRKNITSGSGKLNISLPVYIFSCESNLQRLCTSLGLAPFFLERAAATSDPVERMKLQIAFGLSNTLAYFQIEKPFNPILGETYQGFIDNCPIYGQQISHHPPISALLLQGRGYRVTCALEATVNIHINSANGLNIGFSKVQYDNGQSFCYQTCPGELSGLAMGDRRYRCTGKAYYYDEKNLLFCELNHEDTAGLFARNKWKYVDQLEGTLVKVTKDFLDRFIDASKADPSASKLKPKEQDIVESYFKIGGRWPLSMTCNDEVVYDVPNTIPHRIIDYAFPLNSNSNYREDLFFRKLNDLPRSQSEKERLQVIQRADRKLREKYGPHKDH